MTKEEYDEGTKGDWEGLFPSVATRRSRRDSDEPEVYWEEWANSPLRSPEDLLQLLGNAGVPTRDRAQASALLLSPSTELLRDWRGAGALRQADFVPQDVSLSACPDSLLRFMVRQIIRSFDYLALEGGMLEHRERVMFYNRVIIEILRHEFWMEVEQWPETKLLVDRYLLTDPRIPLEKDHGYSEYGYFIWAHGVPLRFKIQLDDRIRERVLREKEGHESPRIPRENALECYLVQVMAVLDLDFLAGEKLPYAPELLYSQIWFLLAMGCCFHRYYDTLIMLFEGPDYAAFHKKLVQ